ncbi:MAG: hypothetical protein FWH41_10625, partial [Treponema sp.]|nr:hypothetical protein [Treponema sp.]
MEVKPATFARIAGVSRASVSEKMKKKTLIVNAAGFLDTENPVNAAYISRHGQKRAEAEAAEQIQAGGSKSFTSETPKVNNPDDFIIMQAAGVSARGLLNMTLREIVLKYPGLDKIERYAKILKDATMAAEREQRIQERGLTLIPKDFIISRLFSFLEGLVKQIVEYPESAVDKIIAIANTESKTTRIEIVEIMINELSQIVSGAKNTIIAELNGLKSKYQKEIQNQDQ